MNFLHFRIDILGFSKITNEGALPIRLPTELGKLWSAKRFHCGCQNRGWKAAPTKKNSMVFISEDKSGNTGYVKSASLRYRR